MGISSPATTRLTCVKSYNLLAEKVEPIKQSDISTAMPSVVSLAPANRLYSVMDVQIDDARSLAGLVDPRRAAPA